MSSLLLFYLFQQGDPEDIDDHFIGDRGRNVVKTFESTSFTNNNKDDFFSKIKRGIKKMAAGFFISTRHSEPHFELETSEFRCEMNF